MEATWDISGSVLLTDFLNLHFRIFVFGLEFISGSTNQLVVLSLHHDLFKILSYFKGLYFFIDKTLLTVTFLLAFLIFMLLIIDCILTLNIIYLQFLRGVNYECEIYHNTCILLFKIITVLTQ